MPFGRRQTRVDPRNVLDRRTWRRHLANMIKRSKKRRFAGGHKPYCSNWRFSFCLTITSAGVVDYAGSYLTESSKNSRILKKTVEIREFAQIPIWRTGPLTGGDGFLWIGGGGSERSCLLVCRRLTVSSAVAWWCYLTWTSVQTTRNYLLQAFTWHRCILSKNGYTIQHSTVGYWIASSALHASSARCGLFLCAWAVSLYCKYLPVIISYLSSVCVRSVCMFTFQHCGILSALYRVVQKNEATLHFPKYLENYWR